MTKTSTKSTQDKAAAGQVTKGSAEKPKKTTTSPKVSLKQDSAKNVKQVGTKAVKKSTKQASKAVKESLNFAVVKKGNMQYYFEEGVVYEIPKINVAEGKEYVFEEVLLVSKNGNLKIGTPVVDKAKVKVFVIKQKKGEKLHGFKYKAKSRYRKSWGYRKPVTRLRVLEIIA